MDITLIYHDFVFNVSLVIPLCCHHVSIINYLDDFASAETWDRAEAAFALVGDILCKLGIEEALDKACAPSTVMEFLGIQFRTESMTLHVTPDRVKEIGIELREWGHRTKASKTQLQSLIGKLLFVAKCVRPGRLFVGRLLEWLRQMPDKGSHAVQSEYKKDILWWVQFMEEFNGVRALPPVVWSEPDHHLATDASSHGAGGICMGEYFHAKFPVDWQDSWHINELEMATIMVALRLWLPKLKGLRLRVYCDNDTTVVVLNSLKCR